MRNGGGGGRIEDLGGVRIEEWGWRRGIEEWGIEDLGGGRIEEWGRGEGGLRIGGGKD